MQRRVRNPWYFWRLDLLEDEGFTPEEASIIANCAVSSPGIRQLRRNRVRMIGSAQARYGISREDAIAYVKRLVRETGAEIVNWTLFRNILYPPKEAF